MASCCGANEEAVAKISAAGGKMAHLLGTISRIKGIFGSWPLMLASLASLVASFVISGHGCASTCQSHIALFDPALFAVVVCGFPILSEALKALFIEKKIRASLLISIAMLSCLAIGEIFAAGEVAFIMMLGEKLEDWTLRRAKTGLRSLVSLVPLKAHWKTNCPKCIARGEFFKDLPLAEIKIGDIIKILPGETIPLDGVITEGSSSIDQSTMTGESLPIEKAVGDEVYSGTINRFGTILVKVSKEGENSSLQKLIRLVNEAQKKKAPMQRIADKWATILVPASLAIALLSLVGFWLWTGDFHLALTRCVTVMVVFCPCSLALATPTAVVAAIGQATKFGVIIKSGEALEKMGNIDTACFDKTGTLTKGSLAVAKIVSFDSATSEEKLLSLAAGAESSSEHPLAKAIVEEAKKRSCPLEIASDFTMMPGKGIKANISGETVLCGNAAWLENFGVKLSQAEDSAADALRREGNAVILVAKNAKSLGYIALSDEIRPDAAAMLAELPAVGMNSILLTGDHASTASHVAKTVGIDDVRSGLLPEDKAAEITALRDKGASVAMIGDGVNDALALETADVGIAMGTISSDIAQEAADIALVGDDLSKIPYLKRLSNACVRLIKLNITISMCINACAITCSILGILNPVTGALVHNAGSFCVVLNAALLYDRKYR